MSDVMRKYEFAAAGQAMSLAEKVCELRQRIDDQIASLVTSDYRIIAAPYIRNVGDHLIFQGEVDFLAQFKHKCKGAHSVWTFNFPEIAKDEIIFIHGGGFIGDAWGGGTLRVLNRVITRYTDNPIIIFPQSVSFKSLEFLEETKRVWSRHRRLTVCARDQVSYDFLKDHFQQNSVLLVPDMALYADIKKWTSDEPVDERESLLFMRWDCEAKDKLSLVRLQQALCCEARDWPTITGSNAVYREMQRLKVEKKLEEADRFFLEKLHPHCLREGIRFLTPYRDIYTTRLHGLILSMLMNKPRITFIDNSYGKIGALYQTWLKDVEGISEVTKDLQALRFADEKPDITVILAAHKRPDTLRVALDSVYAQKGVKVEVIVVNGVEGPDPVDDIAHEYPSCIYIKDAAYLTLSSKHGLGLELASADMVHFLDDDDYLTDPLFFRKAIDVMRANSKLVFVSGGCDRRVEESDHNTYRMVANPNQVEGLVEGPEFFQGLQVTIKKPIIAATVFRKAALVSGEPLFEVSDSSLFLKALLSGAAFVIPDKVAVYRVWPEQMTKGRGSDFAFKLNVVRQKEALYRQAVGKIADPLGWWSKTFQMNFNYFEKSFKSSEERCKFAEWGLAHAHGSAEMIAFCEQKKSAEMRGDTATDLYAFNRVKNFGDSLAVELLSEKLARPVRVVDDLTRATMVSVGTLFRHGDGYLYGTQKSASEILPRVAVFGTGFRNPVVPEGELHRYFNLDIYALRGRLTEEVLRKVGYLSDGDHPVLGDPGLLYPDLVPDWNGVAKSHDFAVVPHYYDQPAGRKLVDDLQAQGYSVRFIDVLAEDSISVIRDIAASRAVLSSSLHGLIVADAMGIPNRRIIFGDISSDEKRANAMPDFKYADYYSAFDVEPLSPIRINDFDRSTRLTFDDVSLPIPPEVIEARKVQLRAALEEFKRSRERLSTVNKHLRVLIAANSGANRITANTFVATLAGALRGAGAEVDCGIDRFWNAEPGAYDIIHLQWPEALIGWNSANATGEFLSRLRLRLAALKEAGTKIVYTRHNRKPHKLSGENIDTLTEIVETEADAIVHMGETSKRECLGAHPDSTVRHVVIPHHLKDEIDFSISREEARAKLGISVDEKVMLSFGAFRHEEEIALVKETVNGLDVPNFRLLSPLCPGDTYKGPVSDDELPAYFAAADIVFLQRVKVLNSGVLPLAYDAARVCVGPRDGNAGEILSNTGNPTFDPSDRASVAVAIKQGFALAAEGKGASNRTYAREWWNAARVAKMTLKLYTELLGEGKTVLPSPDKAYTNLRRVNIMGVMTVEGDEACPRNWGDELNWNLLKALTRLPLRHVNDSGLLEDDEWKLLFIGSGLSASNVDERTIVWGQGILYEDATISAHPKEVRSVRGPLTREKLLASGIECPEVYGDPALLMPLVYRPLAQKRYRLGFAVHFRERDLPHVQEFRRQHPEILFIDMGDYVKWTEIIDKICSCEKLVSSSLHAIITADAYGIPNVFVKFSDKVLGGTFKFRDYFAGVGREYVEPLDFRAEISLGDVAKVVADYRPIDFDAESLIKASPIPLALRNENLVITCGHRDGDKSLDEALISVIIPVYNVERYLRECLDSVMNQTYRNLEVICVDDGSTDGSLAILKEYEAKDSRFKVIAATHANAGAARNIGYANSHGKYLSFLDADDVFAPTMIEALYKAMTACAADIANCNKRDFVSGSQLPELAKGDAVKFDVVDNVDKTLNVFKEFIGWSWDKLFARSLVEKYDLRFQEQPAHNDALFCNAACCLASRIVKTSDVFIAHRKHAASIAVNRDKHPLCFASALRAIHRMLEAQGFWKRYPHQLRFFHNYIVSLGFWTIDTLKESSSIGSAYGELRQLLAEQGALDKPAEYMNVRPQLFERYQCLCQNEDALLFLRDVALRGQSRETTPVSSRQVVKDEAVRESLKRFYEGAKAKSEARIREVLKGDFEKKLAEREASLKCYYEGAKAKSEARIREVLKAEFEKKLAEREASLKRYYEGAKVKSEARIRELLRDDKARSLAARESSLRRYYEGVLAKVKADRDETLGKIKELEKIINEL